MRLGDLLCIDWDAGEGRLVFQREGEGGVVPMVEPQRKVAAQAARATGGRAIEVSSPAAAREAQAPAALPPARAPGPAPSGQRSSDS